MDGTRWPELVGPAEAKQLIRFLGDPWARWMHWVGRSKPCLAESWLAWGAPIPETLPQCQGRCLYTEGRKFLEFFFPVERFTKNERGEWIRAPAIFRLPPPVAMLPGDLDGIGTQRVLAVVRTGNKTSITVGGIEDDPCPAPFDVRPVLAKILGLEALMRELHEAQEVEDEPKILKFRAG